MGIAIFIAFMITAGSVMACVDILKRITKEIHDIEERTAEKLQYITFVCGENNRMMREEVFKNENIKK